MKSRASRARIWRKVLFPAAILPSIAIRMVLTSSAASAAALFVGLPCVCDMAGAGRAEAGDGADMLRNAFSRWTALSYQEEGVALLKSVCAFVCLCVCVHGVATALYNSN
jgi:hypothetical protein